MARDPLTDRLARLTLLCNEIHNLVTQSPVIPRGKLEDMLAEAEQLCRTIRKELRRLDEK
jgi:hypothetical protein